MIICHLKLGNQKTADEIIKIMKERHSPPTITTYKEILTLLISEHKFVEFQKYFSQIDSQQSNLSTLYIDAQFVLILLGQCVVYNESRIFHYLLNLLKTLDDHRMGSHIFYLSMQCLTNNWHEYIIDLLEIQSNKDKFRQKNWLNFFKYLFDNQQTEVIEQFNELMSQRQLLPLDSILRAFYTSADKDLRLALTYLEQAAKLNHPMRINYFYPLLINAYTNSSWSETDHLRLYRLLNPIAYQIESSTYVNLFDKYFHEYYQTNFQKLFDTLKDNQLQSMSDRFCRLILRDIKNHVLPLSITEQIAPVFLLHNATRQDELAKCFYSILVETNQPSTVFELIDRISTNLSNEIVNLKREIYLNLIAISVHNNRYNLTKLFAEQCVKENIKFDSSIDELHQLTDRQLDDELVQQLSLYKPKESSWKEKFSKLLFNKLNRTKLEEIYSEAKENQRYPISIQNRLLDIYIRKQLPDEAMTILKEIHSNRYKVEPSVYHRLFNLLTVKLNSPVENLQTIQFDHVKYLSEQYEQNFNLNTLPLELTFRLAHIYLHRNDEINALKLLNNKIQRNFNNETIHYLIKYLKANASLLSTDGLKSIGYLVANYRSNESIRRFWNQFFEILLAKTSAIDLVQFYSEAVKKNSQITYLHLFQVVLLFLKKKEQDFFSSLSYLLKKMKSIVYRISLTLQQFITVHRMFYMILLLFSYKMAKRNKPKESFRKVG